MASDSCRDFDFSASSDSSVVSRVRKKQMKIMM